MKQTNIAKEYMNKFANKIPHEGILTKRVEDVTAQVPSIGYLALAAGSLVLSAGLAAFTQKRALANFVGLWVPSFMLIGIYNKLVKLEGHDQVDHAPVH